MEALEVEEISKVLAVLVAEAENYSYVDKLGYAPSKDLAIFYLREALRDLHSMMSRKFENEEAEKVAREIKFEQIDHALQKISGISDRKELREITALIASKALAKSAKLKKERR
ncbi:MAG: type I-A CRISPR-associated protein Csa5 [Archaeoglobus sp.]|jgi:CRISPR-associated protein Csa5|nr:type I-A CRISPR-associated protein Csa5 [Archaeoglobus sp.]